MLASAASSGAAAFDAVWIKARPSLSRLKPTFVPGLMPSRSRMGLGMVTCPLLVMVVGMDVSTGVQILLNKYRIDLLD